MMIIVLTGLKIQNSKYLRKSILILFLFIQFSSNAQIIDSISYDSNSDVEIRTSNKIQKYLKDDFYLYDNENAIAAETWWQKIINLIKYLIIKLFDLIAKGGKPLAYTFYFIVFGVLIFIVTKLLGLNYQTLFLRSKKIKTPNFETFDEDIYRINFDKVIKDAEKHKNYRKAIRYLYINYLKVLADNELINWKINKTNKDYEKEMKKTEHFLLYKHLTLVYEYIWYGEFKIYKSQYLNYNKEFKKALKK